MPQIRSDRRKVQSIPAHSFLDHSTSHPQIHVRTSLTCARQDRVEASPEQLSRCAQAAEQFTSQGGVRTRVIGWYHSHPHITVLPSHVDIKTQATYQMLDDGFVGLIFSTFNQVRKHIQSSKSQIVHEHGALSIFVVAESIVTPCPERGYNKTQNTKSSIASMAACFDQVRPFSATHPRGPSLYTTTTTTIKACFWSCKDVA